MWAFYGEIDLERPKDILNKVVESEMYTNCPDEVVIVSVDLIHDNTRYIIEKKALFGCKKPKTSFLKTELPTMIWYYENGEKKHADQNMSAQFRDKIMPRDLSGYFFFDGEHIEKLYQRKDLKESIAKIMGLTPLKNAVKHLNQASSHFLMRVDNGPGNYQISLINSQLKEATDKYERYDSEVNYSKIELDSAKTEYDNAHESLIMNKNTIDLTNSYDRAERDKESNSEKIVKQMNVISSVFNSSYLDVLSYPLMKRTEEIINTAKSKDFIDEGVPKMHSDAIEYILKRGKCICGADLESHPELVEHIRREQEYLPPKSIGAEVKSFSDVLKVRMSQAKSDLKSFNESYSTYVDYTSAYTECEITAANLLLDIKRLKIGNTKEITERFDKAKVALDKANSKYNTAIINRDNAQKSVDAAKKQLENIARKTNQNRIPLLCMQYAKQLENDISETVCAKEASILRDFNDTLSDVFSKMYHGQRTIALDSDYNVDLLVDGVGATAKSSGTKVVLSFAFVCTLLKLARCQLNDINSELKSEPYPLVMDAPSSVQDQTHIENVFKYTSTVAEQIILFIMDKDWQYAKKALGDKVDTIYKLKKVNGSEINTAIVPLSEEGA